MLYREIIAVCSEIKNTLCGQNVDFLNVKPGGTYSDRWALKSEASKQDFKRLFEPLRIKGNGV